MQSGLDPLFMVCLCTYTVSRNTELTFQYELSFTMQLIKGNQGSWNATDILCSVENVSWQIFEFLLMQYDFDSDDLTLNSDTVQLVFFHSVNTTILFQMFHEGPRTCSFL